jgi:uncharacterized protein (TIGR03067 family)
MIAAITLVVLAEAREKSNNTKVESSVIGTWQAIEAELGGKLFPSEVTNSIKLILLAQKYQVGNDFGTYEIDATATPAAMTIHGTKGPNEGKTILAIYELTGDTLRICYDLSGQKRPTTFATEPGTRQFLVRYKKETSKQ